MKYITCQIFISDLILYEVFTIYFAEMNYNDNFVLFSINQQNSNLLCEIDFRQERKSFSTFGDESDACS